VTDILIVKDRARQTRKGIRVHKRVACLYVFAMRTLPDVRLQGSSLERFKTAPTRHIEEQMDTKTSVKALPSELEQSILGLDHVAIAVTDLDAAIEWYSKSLGFALVERRVTKGEQTSMTSAVMQAGRAIVVLIQGVEPESQVSRFIEHYGPGVQHLALAVDNLDTALARLEATGGGSETSVIEDKGIRQAFLRRDPESGVRIELIERKGGRFTDRSVERLFRAFEERDLY